MLQRSIVRLDAGRWSGRFTCRCASSPLPISPPVARPCCESRVESRPEPLAGLRPWFLPRRHGHALRAVYALPSGHQVMGLPMAFV